MLYTCKQNVFVTELADKLALLDMESGTYYTLNDTGRSVWASISEGKDRDSAVKDLCLQFDVTHEAAAMDVDNLLITLAENGLIHRNVHSDKE